jgi:hypothetical protein
MGEELKEAFFKPLGLPVGSRSKGEIQYLTGENRFLFPNGSMIQLGYCKHANDWEQHLGLQWDDIWLEQAEQFPEDVLNKFRGSNFPNNPKCNSRMLLTFNPGGIGSEWLERRVVNPLTRDRRTIFIKSRAMDATPVIVRDPGYILRSLMSITDPVLRAQWLDGDWDAQSGLMFRLIPEGHAKPATIREVTIPYWADWYGGVDWGEDKPFAYLVAAHWQEYDGGPRHIHVQAEHYQSGLMLDEQAEAALDLEARLKRRFPLMHNVDVRMADWKTGAVLERTSDEQTRSKVSVWANHGFVVYPSFKYGRGSGWQLIKYLLKHGILTIDPDCMALIKEIKGAVRKPGTEDIDQGRCADHALDALRYLICYLFGLDYSIPDAEESRWDWNLRELARA